MDVFEKVSEILSELSEKEIIDLEDKLQDDLGLDSLQMVLLLVTLEENFEIVFDETDMNPFDLINVFHVVNLVEKYLGNDNNKEHEEEN